MFCGRMTDKTMVNAQNLLDRLASGLALGPAVEYVTGQEFACRCFLKEKAIVSVHSLAWRDVVESEPSEQNQEVVDDEPAVRVFWLGPGQPWPPHEAEAQVQAPSWAGPEMSTGTGKEQHYMEQHTTTTIPYATPSQPLPPPPPQFMAHLL